MDKKTRPIYILPPGDLLQIKRYTDTKSKRIEKVVLCKWKEKAGVAIPTYDKIDFKTKVIVREKEDHSWYGLMD